MDKKVIRASYERCLNATARLSAYATSKPVSINEINDRQDIFAADDLIDFCIHTRRLIDNLNLKDLLYGAQVKMNDGKPQLTLGKIIGYLIHHDVLMIIRCRVRFSMLEKWIKSQTREEFFKNVETEIQQAPFSEPIIPHILTKSDKSDGLRLINLIEFLAVFSDQILQEILKSHQWLQDDIFRDIDMNEEDARRILARIKEHSN